MKVIVAGGDGLAMDGITRGIHLRWPLAAITETASGNAALEMVDDWAPDLVLVHTRLRDMFPQVLVEELRSSSDVPILVLAREPDHTEAITTLELGADDYFHFPCGTWEFVARIWAVLRRAGPAAFRDDYRGILICGTLFIDPARYEVSLDDRKVHLTPAEFRLLYLLARHHGDVVSHQLLEQAIQVEGHLKAGPARRHIQRLRWKLRDSAHTPLWIANVHGVGYRFVGPRPCWHPGSGGFPAN